MIKEQLTIFLHKNICCDPSLEPSYRDGSNEGSQHMFSLKNKKIIFELSSIPLLFGALQIAKGSEKTQFAGNLFLWELQMIDYEYSYYVAHMQKCLIIDFGFRRKYRTVSCVFNFFLRELSKKMKRKI